MSGRHSILVKPQIIFRQAKVGVVWLLYASKGQRNTLNSNDTIYQDELLLTFTTNESGYAATFDVGLEMS